MEKIELAAALIERSPRTVQGAEGRRAQVSIVWNCEKTLIPLRARFDYLKQKLIVDLKTFEARGDLPLENAIGKEIGFRKYHIQAAMYVEAQRRFRASSRPARCTAMRRTDSLTCWRGIRRKVWLDFFR